MMGNKEGDILVKKKDLTPSPQEYNVVSSGNYIKNS